MHTNGDPSPFQNVLQAEGRRFPALVNPDLKPFLNLHVNLHVKKKVYLKVHGNLDFQVKVQLNFLLIFHLEIMKALKHLK